MKKTVIITSSVLLFIFLSVFLIAESSSSKGKINIKYQEFKDLRDGKIYKTVAIGNKIWMAANLDFEIKNKSWYYNNDPDIGKIYGRLYNWEGAKMAVPAGWHLPSEDEIKELLDYPKLLMEGAGKFKETGILFWDEPNAGATNITGFSALGAGCRDNNSDFLQLKKMAYFWTDKESGPDSALQYGFYADYDRALYTGIYDKKNAISVRCVKNQK